MDHYQEKLQSLLLHTDEGILATFVIMYVTTVVKTLVFKMLHAKKETNLHWIPIIKGSFFFSQKRILLIDINVKKFGYNEYQQFLGN